MPPTFGGVTPAAPAGPGILGFHPTPVHTGVLGECKLSQIAHPSTVLTTLIGSVFYYPILAIQVPTYGADSCVH